MPLLFFHQGRSDSDPLSDGEFEPQDGRGVPQDHRRPSSGPAGLGMGDLEVSELILSPNPSTGIFKLNWELQTQVTIKIYDSLGKLVFYEKSRDLSKNSEIELKASKGIYFLKVNSLNQEITKKLIIN